jgi:hypothetical protein
MNITEAAMAAVTLLGAKPATGLKHRRHERHLKPARAEIESILRHYWARQEAAVLREVRARVEQALAAHPAPAKIYESDATWPRAIYGLSEIKGRW